jgi:uncharacterized membrane protein (DUF106 family)
MNTILTIVLIVLIIGAFVGFSISVALLRTVAKKYLKLKKQQVALTAMRKEFETAMLNIEQLQRTTIDQAVSMSVRDMEFYLHSLSKDK